MTKAWRTGLGVALLAGAVGVAGGGAALLVTAQPEQGAAQAERGPEGKRVAAATVPAVAKAAAVPEPAPLSAPAPAADMVVRRVLTVPSPFTHGSYVWDESGAPATGPLVITVDLDAQTLSVFRDGYEIGAAVVLYGADWKPTPLGVRTITEKDADHISNLYDAPMPYMLRLTNDGVAIHGSDVVAGGATHGCIGVPTAFAAKLFRVAKLGDKVIVTDGERLKLGGAITAL